MEDITGFDYKHAKRVWNDFKMKNLGEYHDLYVQGNTLLLADVFESFPNKFIDICALDPTYFSSAPGLAWQVCLKKDRSKIRIIN